MILTSYISHVLNAIEEVKTLALLHSGIEVVSERFHECSLQRFHFIRFENKTHPNIMDSLCFFISDPQAVMLYHFTHLFSKNNLDFCLICIVYVYE